MTRNPEQIAKDVIAKIDGVPSAIPEVGVHRDIPTSEYLAWDAASNSRFNHLHGGSPAHMKAEIEDPSPDTPALLLGRAVHAAILEPDVFTNEWIRGPEGDRRTKDVKAQWSDLIGMFGEESILKPAEYDKCLAIRDSVWGRSTAKKLLSGEGECELSLVWNDPATELLCKGRLDRVSPTLAGGVIVDVKTTRDASLFAFERAIFSYGYHRQGAHYLNGAAVLQLPVRHYAIIAVETKRPYEVAVYRLDEGAIDAGQEQLTPLVEKYAECVASNEFPGYPDRVQDIALPTYAWNQIADEKEASP